MIWSIAQYFSDTYLWLHVIFKILRVLAISVNHMSFGMGHHWDMDNPTAAIFPNPTPNKAHYAPAAMNCQQFFICCGDFEILLYIHTYMWNFWYFAWLVKELWINVCIVYDISIRQNIIALKNMEDILHSTIQNIQPRFNHANRQNIHIISI